MEAARSHCNLAWLRANTSPTDFEVVYVEGSRKQIQGLVSDLNADTTAFHSIALHCTPATNLGVLPQAENVPLTSDALKDVQVHESLPRTISQSAEFSMMKTAGT